MDAKRRQNKLFADTLLKIVKATEKSLHMGYDGLLGIVRIKVMYWI